MRWAKGAGIVAVLLALATGVLALAPTASAKLSDRVKFHTPYKYSGAEPNAYSSTFRTCYHAFPYAISQGFLGGYTTKSTEGLDASTLAGTRRMATKDGWRIRVAGPPSSVSGIQLYAICASIDPRLKTTKATTTVLPGAEFQLQARCRSGMNPVSWGWDTTGEASAGAARLLLTEARMTPSGKAWRVHGLHAGTRASVATLFAYCSKRTPQLKEVSAPVAGVSRLNDVRVGCGTKIAYAGGFGGSADAATGTAIYAGTLLPEITGNRAFEVGLESYGVADGSGTAYAYCGRNRFKLKRKKGRASRGERVAERRLAPR